MTKQFLDIVISTSTSLKWSMEKDFPCRCLLWKLFPQISNQIAAHAQKSVKCPLNKKASNSNNASNQTAEKQIPRCVGFKTPIEDHHWKIPSKTILRSLWEVFPKQEPSKPAEEALVSNFVKSMISALFEALVALELEEQELFRRGDEQELMAHLDNVSYQSWPSKNCTWLSHSYKALEPILSSPQ